jgi:hypothetical protein
VVEATVVVVAAVVPVDDEAVDVVPVDVVAAVVLAAVVPVEEDATVVAAVVARPSPSPATATTAAVPVTAVARLMRWSSWSRLVGVQGSVMACS